MKTGFLAIILLLAVAPAGAVPPQNHDGIRNAITAFVREQTQSLPGDVAIKVDEIDHRLKLSNCPALEAFLPPGGSLLGNGTVGVRCRKTGDEKGWTIFVPVHVTDTVTLLIASKPLPQGHAMTAEDFNGQRGELNQTDILTDPAQVVGKILTHGVGAWQIFRREMLRAPYAIKQGQTIHLQFTGPGFKVGNQGQALNNAAEGQDLQVRVSSGQVVSGIARENGIVEIQP